MLQLRAETISVTTNKRRTIDEDKHVIHEGTHGPIISLEKFNTIEMMLKKRRQAATAPATQTFSNLIFCEDCGKGMWYKANQKGYHCGGNSRHRHGERLCLNKRASKIYGFGTGEFV